MISHYLSISMTDVFVAIFWERPKVCQRINFAFTAPCDNPTLAKQ